MTSPSEPCGRIVVAGHGYRIPCAHIKGFCPEHDLDRPRLSQQDFDAFIQEWKPWAARCSTAAPVLPPRVARTGAAPPMPAPRLFHDEEAA